MLTRALTTLKKDGRFVGSAIEQAARAKAACEAARLYSFNIIDQRVRGVTAIPQASAARVATVMAERAVGKFVVHHRPVALRGGDSLLLPHPNRENVSCRTSADVDIQINKNRVGACRVQVCHYVY